MFLTSYLFPHFRNKKSTCLTLPFIQQAVLLLLSNCPLLLPPPSANPAPTSLGTMEEKGLTHARVIQAQAHQAPAHIYRPIAPKSPSVAPKETSPSDSYAIMATSAPLNPPATSLHSHSATGSLSVHPSNCSPSGSSLGGNPNMQLSPANSGQTSYDAFSDFAGLVLGDLQNRVVLAEQNQGRIVQDISQKIEGLKGFLEASVKESCVGIAKKLDEENKKFLDLFKGYYHAHMKTMIENFAALGRSIEGVKTSVNSVNTRLVSFDARLKAIEEKVAERTNPQASIASCNSAPPVANPVNPFQSSFLNQIVSMKSTLVLLGTTIMEAHNEALANDRDLMVSYKSHIEAQRIRMEALHKEINALRGSLEREIRGGSRVIDNAEPGMDVDNAEQGMVCFYVICLWLNAIHRGKSSKTIRDKSSTSC